MKRARLIALVPGLLGMLVVGQAAERSEDWVREKVRQIKESDTQGWRKIPWTGSLLDARQISRKENQPIFLFTLDGNLDTGRC
jgi:hypothetical protein